MSGIRNCWRGKTQYQDIQHSDPTVALLNDFVGPSRPFKLLIINNDYLIISIKRLFEIEFIVLVQHVN